MNAPDGGEPIQIRELFWWQLSRMCGVGAFLARMIDRIDHDMIAHRLFEVTRVESVTGSGGVTIQVYDLMLVVAWDASPKGGA